MPNLSKSAELAFSVAVLFVLQVAAATPQAVAGTSRSALGDHYAGSFTPGSVSLAQLAEQLGAVPRELEGAPKSSFVVTEVAGNFTWVENLRCQRLANGSGVLWASDDFGKSFWAISPPACPGCPYVKHKHLDESLGFSNILGIAVTTKPSGDVYVVASKDKVSHILRTDISRPGSFDYVAELPKTGNGLAMNEKTGKLYSPSEGKFLPLNGAVFEADPSVPGGDVKTIISHGWTDDGAYIDQDRGLLYVSQVVGSKVIVYDLNAGAVNRTFDAPVGLLDDFTLDADGAVMYGADFLHGQVVAFSTDGGSAHSIIASGFRTPTSARWGCLDGAFGLNSTSLFVSEGGGLSPSTHDRKIYEIHNVR